MDRPIAGSRRIRHRLRQAALSAAALAVIVLIVYAAVGALRPSMRRARLRTAVVERGNARDETGNPRMALANSDAL